MWPRGADSTDLSEGYLSADDEVFTHKPLWLPTSPGSQPGEAPVLGGSYSWSDEQAPGSSGDGDNDLYACSEEDQQGACLAHVWSP
jgi:hypothetical protein